jgi:FKBP-type peptidyl-prolyl cis-trans isomerase FkpA
MSVTTVPIRPIKKNSILKYWTAIALVLALAFGLAWVGTSGIRTKYQSDEEFLEMNKSADGVKTLPSGLQIQTVQKGEGPSPTDNDVTLLAYKGMLRDGKIFDENANAPLPVAGVVPGFSQALKNMQRGGQYKIWIPSKLGYDTEEKKNPQTGEISIPANSILIFEIELKDFTDRENFEKIMQRQQQAMQAQQGRPQ